MASETYPRRCHSVAAQNDFPALNINTFDLMAEVGRLLNEAEQDKAAMGAVNWADLGVCEIEYRLSMLNPSVGPHCVVIVDEASPDSKLARWLNQRLDKERFPSTYIECEW